MYHAVCDSLDVNSDDAECDLDRCMLHHSWQVLLAASWLCLVRVVMMVAITISTDHTDFKRISCSSFA
jgi:hypothetical protein